MLGWDIDTAAMTLFVPLGKLERLRDTLGTGANGRRVMLRSVGGQSSASQLRRRLTKLIRQVSGLGPLFGG